MSKDDVEGPHLVDVHVGARIRERRKQLGLSQQSLAEALGLTFQQVQKYERGANRVSCSKLWEIAQTLQASVSYFFEHLNLAGHNSALGVAEDAAEYQHDFIMTPEGVELGKAFPRIASRRVRRQVLELVRALADESGQPGAD